jgi:hypothetical protein
MVNSILSRFKRPHRNDPVFGTMKYMGVRANYWEGKAHFPPTGSVIEVFVDGAADDEFQEQHEFFERLIQEWPHINIAIAKALAAERNSRESKLRDDPGAMFKVSSLSIPKSSLDVAVWEISWIHQLNTTHLWTVRMKGLVPDKIVVDG